ncbi:hypothetical protein C5167_029945 [Papaver somniferum]|nr:hypothetical protein C5167_029945 [Papaver somniferum]
MERIKIVTSFLLMLVMVYLVFLTCVNAQCLNPGETCGPLDQCCGQYVCSHPYGTCVAD